MKARKLGDLEVSALGMGCMGLSFGLGPASDKQYGIGVIRAAVERGITFFDTAEGYGPYGNEKAVGNAIRKSGVSREELFITTKLWVADASYEDARPAFELSLKKLQLDYLDLYLIHQPFGDVYGAWRAMEELYKEGRVKAIGISNFAPDRVMDFLVHQEVLPAVNQVETHPFHQQVEAQKFLAENKVQIELWGPFAEGKNGMFTNELLVGLGKKYRKSVAQIILRWLTQRGVVVIPKSVSPARIAENINVFDFELSTEDMAAIATLDTGASVFFDHRDPAIVKWIGERGRKPKQ